MTCGRSAEYRASPRSTRPNTRTSTRSRTPPPTWTCWCHATKTLGLNDWYLAGPDNRYPLGNLQMLGKIAGPMVKAARPWVPMPLLTYMTNHSIDIYLTTEDLPDPGNRVVVGSDGRITVHWTPNNLVPHRELVRRVARVVRRAGYPLIFTERMGIDTNSHQCGTAVMGTDPRLSVLDPTCRAHDVA